MSRIIPFFILTIFLLLPQVSVALDFMFSNKEYSQNLIIQSRIATKETIDDLINDNSADLSTISLETNSELGGKPTYLFVRIKNTENLAAWGKLSCSINDRQPIEIGIPSLAAKQSYWTHYIITFGGILFPQNEKSGTPNVKCTWDELYTK